MKQTQFPHRKNHRPVRPPRKKKTGRPTGSRNKLPSFEIPSQPLPGAAACQLSTASSTRQPPANDHVGNLSNRIIHPTELPTNANRNINKPHGVIENEPTSEDSDSREMHDSRQPDDHHEIDAGNSDADIPDEQSNSHEQRDGLSVDDYQYVSNSDAENYGTDIPDGNSTDHDDDVEHERIRESAASQHFSGLELLRTAMKAGRPKSPRRTVLATKAEMKHAGELAAIQNRYNLRPDCVSEILSLMNKPSRTPAKKYAGYKKLAHFYATDFFCCSQIFYCCSPSCSAQVEPTVLKWIPIGSDTATCDVCGHTERKETRRGFMATDLTTTLNCLSHMTNVFHLIFDTIRATVNDEPSLHSANCGLHFQSLVGSRSLEDDIIRLPVHITSDSKSITKNAYSIWRVFMYFDDLPSPIRERVCVLIAAFEHGGDKVPPPFNLVMKYFVYQLLRMREEACLAYTYNGKTYRIELYLHVHAMDSKDIPYSIGTPDCLTRITGCLRCDKNDHNIGQLLSIADIKAKSVFPCILFELPEVHPQRTFPIDFMHILILGCIKSLLKLIIHRLASRDIRKAKQLETQTKQAKMNKKRKPATAAATREKQVVKLLQRSTAQIMREQLYRLQQTDANETTYPMLHQLLLLMQRSPLPQVFGIDTAISFQQSGYWSAKTNLAVFVGPIARFVAHHRNAFMPNMLGMTTNLFHASVLMLSENPAKHADYIGSLLDKYVFYADLTRVEYNTRHPNKKRLPQQIRSVQHKTMHFKFDIENHNAVLPTSTFAGEHSNLVFKRMITNGNQKIAQLMTNAHKLLNVYNLTGRVTPKEQKSQILCRNGAVSCMPNEPAERLFRNFVARNGFADAEFKKYAYLPHTPRYGSAINVTHRQQCFFTIYAEVNSMEIHQIQTIFLHRKYGFAITRPLVNIQRGVTCFEHEECSSQRIDHLSDVFVKGIVSNQLTIVKMDLLTAPMYGEFVNTGKGPVYLMKVKFAGTIN